MSLGEAFVDVHADLRPFSRDLRQGVRPIVQEFERGLRGAVGNAIGPRAEEDGRQIGDRLSRGMRNSLTHQFRNKNAFIAIASALGGALDDGISALPTEVKAALVLGILAAAPFVAAALGAAITAGVGVGAVALGILLGSQFQSVQDASSELFRSLRKDLVGLAAPFESAILFALQSIRMRIRDMGPELARIFDVSSGFVGQLTEGVLDGVESFVNSLSGSIEDIEPFVAELAKGFATLGEAIGLALEILASTGDDGVKVLRDLVTIITILILGTANLIAMFTKIVGAIRNVAQQLDPVTRSFSGFLVLVELFASASDRIAGKTIPMIHTNTDLEASMRGLMAATDDETAALEDYKRAIDLASDAVKSQLSLTLDWEESLDRITKALKENGKTLDVTTEKGRNNVREFMRGIDIAEKRAIERVKSGELTAAQAASQYQLEIDQLRDLANAAGISDQKFNDLFSEIINTSALRISSEEMGVDALTGELDGAAGMAQRLLDLLRLIRTASVFISGGIAGAKVRQFDNGGIVRFPETVSVAEGGSEVILPITKPARAAQLLEQSGLASMLSSGPSQILVFVGNEQLESRMVRVVERNNNSQALALAHGGRS